MRQSQGVILRADPLRGNRLKRKSVAVHSSCRLLSLPLAVAARASLTLSTAVNTHATGPFNRFRFICEYCIFDVQTVSFVV